MNQKDCFAQGQFGFRDLSHEPPLRPSCPIILVSTFCYFPFGSQDGRHFHHACVVMCLCARIEHVLGAMTSMGHVEKVSSESKRMARRTRKKAAKQKRALIYTLCFDELDAAIYQADQESQSRRAHTTVKQLCMYASHGSGNIMAGGRNKSYNISWFSYTKTRKEKEQSLCQNIDQRLKGD